MMRTGLLILFSFFSATCLVFGAETNAVNPSMGQERIPTLQVGDVTYTNVFISARTGNRLHINHTRGTASIKIDDIAAEDRDKVGLVMLEDPNGKKSDSGTNDFLNSSRDTAQTAMTNVVELWRQEAAKRGLPFDLSKLELPLMIGAGVVALVIHLIYSLLLAMICRKASSPPGPLVWLPVFQMFPQFKAAKMSVIWPALLLIGGTLLVVAGVVQPTGMAMMALVGVSMLCFALFTLAVIVWGFKISIARNKSPIWGILFLIGCAPIAFLYLALSD